DLAFFPYIRYATLNEKGDDGQLLPASARLVVFPGLELTLGLPCQALLLFDPAVMEADLSRAMATLGIAQAPPEAVKGNPVQRLPITNLNDIYGRLNEHDSLRGRFIVLPNVNDGGDDT